MRNAITRPAWSGLLILCLLFLPMACRSVPDAGISLGEQERILAAAEKPFVLMGQKDFRTLWGSISQRSRVAILNDVLNACRSLHVECDRNELQADFAKGGPSAMIYWENYLAAFDPNTVLRESRWSMGNVRADEAEVLVRHRESQKAAILRIMKENGEWKMGLDESFGVRKWIRW